VSGLGTIPVDAIDRSKVARALRKPAFHEDRPINAFDSETTADGKIYLLSFIYGGKEWGATHIGHANFEPLRPAELFGALTKYQTHAPAVNVWYNLDFDANAIIGTVLTEEQMYELADTNTTNFTYNGTDYEMTYIKKKLLSFTDEHRHRSTHYDISQFFELPLDDAARHWLDEEKDDIDPTRAAEYPWKTIVKYAEKDAALTQRLWEQFVRVGEGELGIPLGKPISTGYVGQNVCFNELRSKPAWLSTAIQKLAGAAYHGGRFEVYRRGSFDAVVGLDINSAYPHHMSQLPDLASCEGEIVPHPSLSTIEDADYGFVDMTVTTDPARNIQPFAVKDKRVCYPALTDRRITVTRDELLFALQHGYVEDVELHEAACIYEADTPVRPFSFLRDWYDDRLHYKELFAQTGNPRYDKFQYILKVIINSVYGKTCQVTLKTDRFPEAGIFEPEGVEFVTEGLRNNPLKAWYEGGELLNPFFASYVTARTRLQLHEAALSLGVEDEAIMFATDCLMLEADAVNARDVNRLVDPDALGMWDHEYDGSAFVVGSGVYDVFSPDGELTKMAKRGFREVSKTYPSWRDAALGANGAIELPNERPAKFKEWLLHKGNPELARRPAEFFRDERTLVANFDRKRDWNRDADFAVLLDGNHGSRPLAFS